MRGRLASALACLLSLSCASGPAPFRVPESALPLSDRPPAPPSPPLEGAADSDASRPVRLLVLCGGTTVLLDAYCRVGVFTTLENVRPAAFVTRESWGRLGKRPPRLLARVRDDFARGVTARVRPLRDGALEWQVEVADGEAGPSRPVGLFHGQTIEMPRPRRHGYLLGSVAPAGSSGVVAWWEGGPTVSIGVEPPPAPQPPRGALRFRAEGLSGFILGAAPHAEAFVEEWSTVEPVLVDADGVERADFRVAMRRSAAGFRTGPKGDPTPFGGRDLEFRFTRIR